MSFIVNRWVRGTDFFGRQELLSQLQDRGNKATWILGNRRVGKTSLLRQIEWLCRESVWPDCIALYWDLQGAGTKEGLKDSFLESLEDSDGIDETLGLDIDKLEDMSFFDVLNKFRRRVKGLRDKRFLLLIDECEELVDIAANEPNLLNSFRKLSQADVSLTVILAGSSRFTDLDESESRTSLFLPDFLPPLRLGPFSSEETIALLTGEGIDEKNALAIQATSFGNPHLVQVMGEYLSRLGSFENALQEIKKGKIGDYFFQSNFQCLPLPQRSWWKSGEALARLGELSPNDTILPHMEQSCIIRVTEQGEIEISPLLKLIAGGATPNNQAVKPRNASEPAPLPSPSKAHGLLDWASKNPNHLLVLPPENEVNPEESVNPPGLAMMASMAEPREKLQAILDRASPEYVLGQNPTERTAVYLVGLAIYRHHFGCSPFSNMNDPWERAGAISEKDVTIIAAQATRPLNSKTAMVLVRCLKAAPKNRYARLEILAADLGNK